MRRDDIPGPASRALATHSSTVISRANRMTLYDIAMARGEGAVLVDVDGNRYLDCLAGASANVLGYGRAELVAAYAEQAAVLQHSCFAYSPTAPALELAELLVSTVPAPPEPYQVVLGINGSDVNGAAIEIARRATGRRGILAFDWAYHGTTGLSQPASGFTRLNQDVYPESAEFVQVPFPGPTSERDSLAHVERALAATPVACVLVEAIQGDGGVRVPSADFVRSLQRLAREHGAVFVVDEVQSGMGRTGKLWCWEHFLDAPPDLITIGKGLAAGYAPVAAVLGKTRLIDALSFGQQTLTYAGHPPSCAVAARCLRIMLAEDEASPVRNAAARGEQLVGGLAPLCDGRPLVAVRGRGLMVGVQVDLDGEPLRGKAFAFALVRRGIHAGLVGGAQDVIRLSPPLILSPGQVDEIVAAFAAVVDEFRGGTPSPYLEAARRHSIGL